MYIIYIYIYIYIYIHTYTYVYEKRKRKKMRFTICEPSMKELSLVKLITNKSSLSS